MSKQHKGICPQTKLGKGNYMRTVARKSSQALQSDLKLESVGTDRPHHLHPIIPLKQLQIPRHCAIGCRVNPKKDFACAVVKANRGVIPLLPLATDESPQLNELVVRRAMAALAYAHAEAHTGSA